MTDDGGRAIRAGFGRLAVAVAVITALDDGRPHGCTGMAWAEHATPPLLLTTQRVGGRTRELVGAVRRFGVNVLSEQQEPYVAKFAARSPEPGARFSGVPFSSGPVYGIPVLDGGVAAFELGAGQAQPVAALMRCAGLVISEIRRDLAGSERCLVVRHG